MLTYHIYKLPNILTIHVQVSVGKMIYDERKGKGVKEKGTTCHKVFINKEASYSSVLERVRDEMYDTTENEG